MIARNCIACFAFFIAGIHFLFAQPRTITVLSSKDNSPLEQAYVVFIELNDSGEKKEKRTVLTAADGTAAVPLSGDAAVKISHLGFEELTDTLPGNQSKTYYLKPLSLPIEGVVITAQYTPDDLRNSVFPVEVIKKETIEQRGATSVREVLTQESNIRITQDNILGSTMTMQGLGGEQIKILVDGIPVIGRENGNIDLSQLNLNNTRRIEIIKGPVSVQYGTHALGGVLNIITNHEQYEGWSARMNGYYETAGVYNADAGIGFGKKNHSVDLSGGRNFFDGYSAVDTSRFKEWKPREQYFGMLKYRFGFKRLRFTAKSDAFYEKITNRGMPRAPYNITAFDDYYYTQRYSGAASVNGEILENHYLEQLAAYSYYSKIKNTYYKDLVTLESTITPNPTDQDTARFYSWFIRGYISRNKPFKLFNYQTGYDINIDQAKGRKIKHSSQTIADYAFFASFNIKPVSELALQAGIRWSYNTDYTPPLTPAFNIKWTPMDELVIRTSYARGFRAPSLKELYLDFVDAVHNIHGSSDLKAESSNSIAFSMDYLRNEGNHRISFQPSFFFNDIDDRILLVQVYGTEYRYVNIDRYQTIGGNLQVGYRFKELMLEANGGFTGNRINTEKDFKWSPELLVQGCYLIPKAKITVSVFYKFNGEQVTFTQGDTDELLTQTIAPYHFLDCSLNRKFWENRISLTFGVKNILDVNNVSSTGGSGIHSASEDYISIAWGRSLFASLKFVFDIKK
ncbi:MAG TPA: TonB-dependent receptor [Chitinophagales bacterium]|nr:TonB-dependent receptor [Chitinophagales bacterium]